MFLLLIKWFWFIIIPLAIFNKTNMYIYIFLILVYKINMIIFINL